MTALNPKLVPLSVIGVAVSLLVLADVASAQTNEPNLAHIYLTQAKEINGLSGAAYGALADGRIILGGGLDIAARHQLPGVNWLACLKPDGDVLWAVRAEEEPDAASLFPLRTDGASVWSGGLRKDGSFRFARFNALTLQKEASIQLTFASAQHSSPCLQLHSPITGDFDLQVSLVQGSGSSIRVALVSREMRLIFDKTYTFSFLKGDSHLAEAGNGYLIRLPDKTGYYLCLRHSISAGGRQGVAIMRLQNDGAVKWANSYPISPAEFEVEPHIGSDGAILLGLSNVDGVKDSPLIKIATDGTVSWAQSYPGLEGVSVANAHFAWTPHRFSEPYLYATSGQLKSAKLFTYLLGLNYSTGQIEKQVKLNSPGTGLYVERSSDSLYVSLLDMKYGNRGGSQGSLVRLGLDLNFRSVCALRDVEFHWPELCALSAGRLLVSYGYHAKNILAIQTVDENLESANGCEMLQKAKISLTKTNFQARPITINAAPLEGIALADVNSAVKEADLKLLPFALEEVPCTSKR